MEKRFEARGITDLIAKIGIVVQGNGIINYETVGGTGSQYSHVSFKDDEGIVYTANTRTELVGVIFDCLEAGCRIMPSDVQATNGRNKYYWFSAEVDEPVVEEPEPSTEDDSNDEEDSSEEETVDEENNEEENSSNEEESVDTEEDIKASAAAKEFAKENGLDLTEVTGTGKNGSITKKDVVDYKDSL